MDFNIVCAVILLFKGVNSKADLSDLSCGVDSTNGSEVFEGSSSMTTYPWMGILYYPIGGKALTTVVVLVTKQIVLGSATEVDKIPKHDFRATSRVVLGHRCGTAPPLRILDYTFHPDFSRKTYSAPALLQLDVDHVKQNLQPICAPPNHFINPQIYAMTISNDCAAARVNLYKMEYVGLKRCHAFYKQIGLNVDHFWASHTTCARAATGGRCVWRSGAALVVRQGGHWRLLGFGIHGPGCNQPARFMDYGMYHAWVETAVSRIGVPAVSRIDDGHVVLRRKLGSIQRFGPCDEEELQNFISIDGVKFSPRMYKYVEKSYKNLTLSPTVDYTCIILTAVSVGPIQLSQTAAKRYIPTAKERPKISVRNLCPQKTKCLPNTQLFLELEYNLPTEITINYYGKTSKLFNLFTFMKFVNNNPRLERPILSYSEILQQLKSEKFGSKNVWFYAEDFWPRP